MTSTKYIGMDVHKESISIQVMNSVLNATETKYFPYRKTIRRKINGRKRSETVQVIDERTDIAWWPRFKALDMAFKLRGDYAPKQIDTEPDVNNEVAVINIGGIPRYNE